MTSRELVRKAITFDHPERIPRDFWVLPWVDIYYPGEVRKIREEFVMDFEGSGGSPGASRLKGDLYEPGEFIDEWNCTFVNIQKGVHGEVKNPLVKKWGDIEKVKAPEYMLELDTDKINTRCRNTDKWVTAACCPRPFERMQFLCGSTKILMEVMDPCDEFLKLKNIIHDFYMREIEAWCKTDIDGVMFMDDWGAQRNLLIPPEVWKKLFKPLYKDYCDIIHRYNKFAFMHSDGNIEKIYLDIIEVGVNVLNSQLFTMNIEQLGKLYKGKITFWGEVDRQHILSSENTQDTVNAVKRVADALYDKAGGVIAQCEFGPGARPENVKALYREWNKVGNRKV